MTKYYVDSEGAYLGGFDGAPAPSGSTEVPSAPANAHDRWNGAWVAAQVVPEVLTPRQFRQALTHFGHRPAVEAAVAGSDQDTKDWYEYATSFERHHPILLAMAQQMGFTSGQMDAVWTYGASI